MRYNKPERSSPQRKTLQFVSQELKQVALMELFGDEVLSTWKLHTIQYSVRAPLC